MPARRSYAAKKSRRTRRRQLGMGGSGLFSWIKNKALPWLKKNHVISTVGKVLGSVGVPYASAVGKFAGAHGYGRRRAPRKYMKGYGINLAGGAINPAGGRMGYYQTRKMLM